MSLNLLESTRANNKTVPLDKSQQEKVKLAIRKRIYDALNGAKNLPSETCLCTIRNRLFETQEYCQSVGKTFIFVEESVTCDQYELGGRCQNQAILFRGPNEDASVAICVTAEGSLLHRNDSPWKIYRNMGDVNPENDASQASY